MMRIRAQWAGPGVVGPSVSTFYWDASEVGGPALIRAFFDDIKASLPDQVTITVDGTGDILNDTNGNLVGTWTEDPGAVVTGTSTGDQIEGVGTRVRWNTNGIHGGRRVKGTTFIVPLPREAFDATGIPGTIVTAALQAAADDLVEASADHMWIWSRPSPGGSDGEHSAVTGASVPRLTSWLRSRRT